MPAGFFKMKYHGLIIALIEISGPPNTKDHAHFVGDKNKLAKNLKRLLKKVREMLKREGDHELYQCIKLYSIQFYNHKLYLYSLRQPTRGFYVFQEEFHFDLSCEVGFFSHFLSRCLRKLAKVQVLLKESSASIKEYFESDYMGNTSDATSDSRDSLYTSPHKKSKAPSKKRESIRRLA